MLELDLLSRGYEAPDQALLYLKISDDGGTQLRAMAEAYTWLAQARGWRLSVCVAIETKWALEMRTQKEVKRLDDTNTPIRAKSRSLRHLSDPRAWRWSQWSALRIPRDPEDDRAKRLAERAFFVSTVLGGLESGGRALRFEGPHVAALLAHEGGLHISTGLPGGERPTVAVTVQPGSSVRRNPTEVAFESQTAAAGARQAPAHRSHLGAERSPGHHPGAAVSALHARGDL